MVLNLAMSIHWKLFHSHILPFFSHHNLQALSILDRNSHKWQHILSPSGIHWGSFIERIFQHQSNHCPGWVAFLSALSVLAAMFRFIWADIRPENEQSIQRILPSPFCGRLNILGSSVFISRLVTAVRWSVSSQWPAGTVSRVTETDRRWTGGETCHRLTRLPAGGLCATICFRLNR